MNHALKNFRRSNKTSHERTFTSGQYAMMKLAASKANIGSKRSKEFCENQSKNFKGRVAWNKGKKLTEEHKNNLKQKRTSEAKQKMSEARIGKIPWNKGIPHSEQTKEKISKTKNEREYDYSKSETHKANIGIALKAYHLNKNK